ncbi:3-hydroxyacyl-CoA dehydrogenase family protein [Sedimentibacter sp. zth1]|uniref:3-hydroxyacyl-CoA dehydrogenase family protein n=1 Tax=Sedimentibacter sp. zth1 TaxID=2816908 RepID=UPI001A9281B2|nr:3-hydroxyacyl-CoA dehydrogenase family protein [Sedimentibacter sp. zth1]QSX05660.1 3-hydroxyacyl-CoA dehydrogenase family protein [Sedimentibacter sp. zth1]
MKIGIIGAGVMGSGVAERFSKYGHEIKIVDINESTFDNSRTIIKNSVRMTNMFSKGQEKVDYKALLDNITYSTEYVILSDVDIVIENVVEKVDVKKGVYEKLEKVCKEECIYLVNTSCISITKIGSFTNRADRVIGTHFMNPVPMKKACEVILGHYTSEKTIDHLKEVLKNVDIKPIIVNDYPGFVSNRISHLLMNEAACVVQDNVATPENVDAIFKLCFGHKMGPLETADLIGIDTVVDSLDVLYENYHDPKFRVAPILRKMVDAKLFGRKSGEGFFKYK